MVPIRPQILDCHDSDVRALQYKAVELYEARVEQRRRKLECLTAEGLIVLGRANLPAGTGYLADALITEFCRRLSMPLEASDIEALRKLSAECAQAVEPDEALAAS